MTSAAINSPELPEKPRLRRPSLRVQLTALYAGLAVALVAVVLGTLSIAVVRDGSSQSAGSGQQPPDASIAANPPAGNNQLIGLLPPAIALVVVAATVLLAWWLAGRFLRPLRAMTSTARQISATNLHQRLQLRGPKDELTELGRTLDDLFDRLEASFESQRHFVANASHELRTPLAGQRAVLQVALADPEATLASLRAAGQEAIDLGDRQARLIDALLALAEGQKGVERWESFDLAHIAARVLDTRQAEARRRGVTVRTRCEPAPLIGDPSLVESMLANLLDNAIRHNLPGGTVDLETGLVNGQARLAVANTGRRIPARELDRLFHPFQRLGAERTQHTEGHGLGLSIVRAIADAHGAVLTVYPRTDGGLDMTAIFR